MTTNLKLKLTTLLLIITTTLIAQKKNEQYIISEDISITKYHDLEQLEEMPKGKLLELYNRRIEIIIKILPNIAFATKPGVTMTTLGIPDTKGNRKALQDNIEATTTYFDNTVEFQKIILPYSDRSSLIRAILFYEDTLKALHTYDQFD
ncbi:MAG: hypothetical protein ACSHW7_06305 [Patiriisocius sp.]|uniref:hypothetical protein n=1 Tax=Patiriisocius sp. TaxID=2822396 RepID=UPI003EF1E29F